MKNLDKYESMDSEKQRAILARYLNSKFKKEYFANKVNSRRDQNESFGANMVHFDIELSGLRFDYSMGIGHFFKSNRNNAMMNNWLLKNGKFESWFWDFLDRKSFTPRHAHLEPRPLSPKLSDIFYSLILDSEACEMSFNDWCMNLGCNTDSIKAKKTYDQCRELGFKVKALFKPRIFEKLKALYSQY